MQILSLITILIQVERFATLTRRITMNHNHISLTFLTANYISTHIRQQAQARRHFRNRTTRNRNANRRIFAFGRTARNMNHQSLNTIRRHRTFFNNRNRQHRTNSFRHLNNFRPFAFMTNLTFTRRSRQRINRKHRIAKYAGQAFRQSIQMSLNVSRNSRNISRRPTGTKRAATRTISLRRRSRTRRHVTSQLTSANNIKRRRKTLRIFRIFTNGTNQNRRTRANISTMNNTIFHRSLFRTNRTNISLYQNAIIRNRARQLLVRNARLNGTRLT